MHKHEFTSTIVWTGNNGAGTSNYHAYERTWNMQAAGKPVLACSNDPLLGGDQSKYNPEDLLLSALSSCHMLWYLHLSSDAGVVVTAYEDTPIGIGESEPDGTGRFVEVILKPKIIITGDSDATRALQIHDEIHRHCFIARSVNFPVRHEPSITREGE